MRNRFGGVLMLSRCAACVMGVTASCTEHIWRNEDRVRRGRRIASDRNKRERDDDQQGHQAESPCPIFVCESLDHILRSSGRAVCVRRRWKYRIRQSPLQSKTGRFGGEVRSWHTGRCNRHDSVTGRRAFSGLMRFTAGSQGGRLRFRCYHTHEQSPRNAPGNRRREPDRWMYDASIP